MGDMIKSIAFAATLCVLTGTAYAADGVLIVQKITTGNGTTQTHQVQMEAHRMRAESGDMAGGKQVMIFDGTKQVLTVIYPDRKAYSEMTQADADKFGGQMAGAMAQLEAQLKNMPPAQRAQMEAVLKGRGGAAAATKTVYKRAGTDTVGKWTCDKYEGFDGATKTQEVCTVDPKALGFGATDFEVSKQMAEFFKKLVPQGSAQMFSIGTVESQGYSGVPVRHMMIIAGRQVTTEITEVTRQSFPDSAFQVPAGYEKTEFMGGGRGRGRD